MILWNPHHFMSFNLNESNKYMYTGIEENSKEYKCNNCISITETEQNFSQNNCLKSCESESPKPPGAGEGVKNVLYDPYFLERNYFYTSIYLNFQVKVKDFPIF